MQAKFNFICELFGGGLLVYIDKSKLQISQKIACWAVEKNEWIEDNSIQVMYETNNEHLFITL